MASQKTVVKDKETPKPVASPKPAKSPKVAQVAAVAPKVSVPAASSRSGSKAKVSKSTEKVQAPKVIVEIKKKDILPIVK